MHNINVTIQIVSAQKNAYARTLSYECVRALEREIRESVMWFQQRAETRVRMEFTIDFTSIKFSL